MSTHQEQAPIPDGPAPRALLAASDTMASVYEELFGRSPTYARTYWSGPDTVVCVLEDARVSLMSMGDQQWIRAAQSRYERAGGRQIAHSIELSTGRKLRAFHYGINNELIQFTGRFVLRPAGYAGPSCLE